MARAPSTETDENLAAESAAAAAAEGPCLPESGLHGPTGGFL
uniref:Uncharacterized protein n=1 Tax=Oryza sativa subsp. japonica TaxID=39947 RepID=Q2R2N7_ORYSJ|nr:hypothetical protein LOC_Os11g35189 [Oryza sativa Japonica Group]